MSIELPEWFTFFIKAYILYLLVLLKIEVSQVSYLLATVFVDSFFGVIKSWRMGISFDKGKFVWGILKKLSILFIPFLLATFGLIFNLNLVFLVHGFIYIIAVNDTISIVSNIATIYSGKEYKTVDLIEKGIHALIDFLTMIGLSVVSRIQKMKLVIKRIMDEYNKKL